MNITTNTMALANELRILTKIAPPKPSIAILSHVLLRAEDQLYLSATDLEIAMSAECRATVHETGSMALPAKTLLDILEQLPDADVNIDNGKITSGAFRSKLSALPHEDFPALPAINGDSIPLSGQSLRRLIDRTAYAISDKTQKYVLDGALLSLNGEVMAMVSTDGKRLSVATAARAAGIDQSVVLPSKTLDVLLAQSGDLLFSRGERHLFFSHGKRLLISRMLEGEFPRYERIIPKGNDQMANVSRIALAAALKRVGLVAEGVHMTFTSGALNLTSRSTEIGDADESVAIRYDGPDVHLCANWKYLLDFLDHATEQTVTIAIKTSATPLLLTDGNDFINVIMVMRD